MTRITLNGKTYGIPARWSEVTDRRQFTALAKAMLDFETGVTGFDEFRIALVLAVLGIDAGKVNATDTFIENIYRIGELVTFPYESVTNQDGSTTVNISIRLTGNLLPEVAGRKGFQYHTSQAGIVDTDITAGQYSQALELLQLFALRQRQGADASTMEDVLTRLAQTLYPLEGKDLESLPVAEKAAIFYNWRGIMATIQEDPDYALLFNRNPSRSSAPSLGPQGAILSLSKAGYGDIAQIRSLDIHTFLSAMVQQTVDSIHTLKGAGMKPGQIADKLNLQLEQILPYVTETED